MPPIIYQIGLNKFYSFLVKPAGVIVAFLGLALVQSCAPTGLSQFSSAVSSSLPQAVPKRVLVAPLSGDIRVSRRATQELASGLTELGFEVLPPERFWEALDIAEYPSLKDLTSEQRACLVEKLQIEGVFLGVVGVAVTTRATAYMEVRLINPHTESLLWLGRARDPRILSFSLDIQASLERTINKLQKLLQSDLKRLKKVEAKQK